MIERLNIHKTSWAVKRSEGWEHSIFRIRSFALSDMMGHGSDSKSICPFNTASNIPCCVSESQTDKTFSKHTHNEIFTRLSNIPNHTYLPKMAAHHLAIYTVWPLLSIHLLLVHNAWVVPLEQHNMGFQPHQWKLGLK